MKLGCVILASGHSKRFGSDKLLHIIDGKTLCQRVFEAVPKDIFQKAVVVTRDYSVAETAAACGLTAAMNPDESDDTAVTIELGLRLMSTEYAGVMFMVCDQPYLTGESIKKLARAFLKHPDKIARLSWNGETGNPVIFPAALIPELKALTPHESGRQVIERHRERVLPVEAGCARELVDIDTEQDILK